MNALSKRHIAATVFDRTAQKCLMSHVDERSGRHCLMGDFVMILVIPLAMTDWKARNGRMRLLLPVRILLNWSATLTVVQYGWFATHVGL